MTYKNPRLKHVKKIEEICADIVSVPVFNTPTYVERKINDILHQCNLLLETKKAKKRKYLVGVDMGRKDADCTVMGYMDKKGIYYVTEVAHSDPKEESKPSPQSEIETFSTFEIDDMEDGVDEALARKLNLVIDQVNKLTKTK